MSNEKISGTDGKHRLDHAPFRIAPGSGVRLDEYDTQFTGGFEDRAHAREALREDVSDLTASQELLWAGAEFAVLVIFQAMDAAGKDSAIKHVMSGVNPQGCEVHSFGPPSDDERRHHFLWRAMQRLPACGRISIFNRSYYEEVLVVRVHPELLDRQWLPPDRCTVGWNTVSASHAPDVPTPGAGRPSNRHNDLWERRYREINDFERTLCDNGVVVVKFFLNVSREKQRKRFLKRLNRPDKHWKFSARDVRERAYWDDYMRAYEAMLSATSTAWAPWYIIPADKKWFIRACVADIIASRIASLNLTYPQPDEVERRELLAARRELEE